MRKLTNQLAISLLTFLFGVTTFVLWTAPFGTEEIPSLPLKSNVPEGWRKIDVNGRASFYLPPNMKSALACNLHAEGGGGNLLGNQNLVLSYGFGERISCDGLLDFADKATLQTSTIEVNGKRGMLSTWLAGDYREMRLCFSDIGDGKTSLNLLTIYRGKDGLDMTKQIFDSVEFR